LISPLNLK